MNCSASRVILPYFNVLIGKNTVKLDQDHFGELSVKRVRGLKVSRGPGQCGARRPAAGIAGRISAAPPARAAKKLPNHPAVLSFAEALRRGVDQLSGAASM
jgi:hypothetical protein